MSERIRDFPQSNKTRDIPTEEYGFYSRLLNKPFNTVKELKEAEDEYRKQHEMELKAKQEKQQELNKINQAYDRCMALRKEYTAKIREADNDYYTLKNNFIKKYGGYHNTQSDVFDFEGFFNELLSVFNIKG